MPWPPIGFRAFFPRRTILLFYGPHCFGHPATSRAVQTKNAWRRSVLPISNRHGVIIEMIVPVLAFVFVDSLVHGYLQGLSDLMRLLNPVVLKNYKSKSLKWIVNNIFCLTWLRQEITWKNHSIYKFIFYLLSIITSHDIMINHRKKITLK